MPSLSDDGRSVRLDLHGARIEDAERLLLSAARLAADRGRSTLTIVHGASTSSTLYRNRTIRHALYDLIDDGHLDDWITGEVRLEGSTVLSLPVDAHTKPERISLRDLGP